MLDGQGFLFAYDLDGKFRWKKSYGQEWQGSYPGARTTPTVDGGRVYVFSGTGVLACLSAKTGEQIWSVDALNTFQGKNISWGMTGSPLVDGCLYGSNFKGIPKGDWVCLDWDAGKVMYEAAWNANKGPVIYADGMLYCYDENTGDVALVKPSPKSFEIISSFRVTAGSGKHWAHPAISDGRLYIRHGDALMAFDIRKNSRYP